MTDDEILALYEADLAHLRALVNHFRSSMGCQEDLNAFRQVAAMLVLNKTLKNIERELAHQQGGSYV